MSGSSPQPLRWVGCVLKHFLALSVKWGHTMSVPCIGALLRARRKHTRWLWWNSIYMYMYLCILFLSLPSFPCNHDNQVDTMTWIACIVLKCHTTQVHPPLLFTSLSCKVIKSINHFISDKLREWTAIFTTNQMHQDPSFSGRNVSWWLLVIKAVDPGSSPGSVSDNSLILVLQRLITYAIARCTVAVKWRSRVSEITRDTS